jgi:hypothetical protein
MYLRCTEAETSYFYNSPILAIYFHLTFVRQLFTKWDNINKFNLLKTKTLYHLYETFAACQVAQDVYTLITITNAYIG